MFKNFSDLSLNMLISVMFIKNVHEQSITTDLNSYKKYLLSIKTYTLVVVDSKPDKPYITVRYVKPKT